MKAVYNVLMKTTGQATIALNRKAHHEYSIEERHECGLVLLGWEVKALRAGQANISESYALIHGNEIWLLGSRINPLLSASTHVVPEPDRTRKLLLKSTEISRLRGAVERKGYTLVPLRLYWKYGLAKLELGLARGRKQYDKRQVLKKRDWARQQSRLRRHQG